MNTNLDPHAGTYTQRQTVDWITSPSVKTVSYTVNGLMPTLSEYVAYDSLTPPNPFIAVTQDSRGNVVYDGGFPKFYNVNAPEPGTPFSGLSGAFKFLYNALNFVSNKSKVDSGNRNVLILGDALTVPFENYPVKSDAPNGFRTSFTRLLGIAGYVPTIKDRSDYADTLNPSASELAGYCAIIVMASAHKDHGFFTQQAVRDIVAYREAGNGVILITDHGEVLTDINHAANGAYSGFFRTVNQLAVEFGTYFTGNFDRTPVNVGFLRATYGDHPLYANMADSEFIAAGPSESKIVVTQYPRYLPRNIPSIDMEDGSYHVQILTALLDGTVEVQRQMFIIDNSGVERIPVRKLYVRATSTSPFIVNFSKGGWCVYRNGLAIRMTPQNTRMWDDTLKQWVAVK